MKKGLFLFFLVLYAISFIPSLQSIGFNGQVVSSENIVSVFGPQTVFSDPVTDVFNSFFNTVLLDLPASYGTLILLFNAELGQKLILIGYSLHVDQPINPTYGWTIGLIAGWIARIWFLVYLYEKYSDLKWNN